MLIDLMYDLLMFVFAFVAADFDLLICFYETIIDIEYINMK